MFDDTLVGTHLALRNRKRKTIRLSHQTPSHKPSSMPETRRTLSHVQYRLAHNWLYPRPPTYNCLQLSKSPIKQNKWSNRHQNPNRREPKPSAEPPHVAPPAARRLVLNRNRSEMRLLSTSLRMAHPLPPRVTNDYFPRAATQEGSTHAAR
jgi:hypothetical protein